MSNEYCKHGCSVAFHCPDCYKDEIAALKAELYDALTTVLYHCSCDGEYDCDRCEANLERRRQLKQEGE